jgi:hypothetical protein
MGIGQYQSRLRPEHSMNCAAIYYSRHAFERMFERTIAPNVIRDVVAKGEIIATYPEDQPYPSALILGFDQARPIHVVVARNAATSECIVVTVYVPDPALWDETFKQRRTS